MRYFTWKLELVTNILWIIVDTNDQVSVFNPTIMNIVINFIPNEIISCNGRDDDGLTITCDVFIKKPHSC